MSEQLRQIELFAEQLYNGNDPDDRIRAQAALRGFQTSVGFLGDCRNILENSRSPYALLLATQSMLTLMTRFWNQFLPNQTAELSAYLLSFLGNRCNELPEYVRKSATQVLARVTKFGFLGHQHHRDLCGSIDNFFQASLAHFLTGLQILADIVDEMNLPNGSLPNTEHRKISAGFRDMHLKNIFQRAMEQCRAIVENRTPCSTSEEKGSLLKGVLELACRCLNFDFIGNMPHDAEQEAGTIQIPAPWKSVLEGTGIIELSFELFFSSSPEQAGQCAELLRLLSACRKGVFSEQGRVQFLSSLLQGATTLLRNHQELVSHTDVFYHFSRFLDQLKRNFQLKELLSDPLFVPLLELIALLTQSSFRDYQENMTGLHYLIGLWYLSLKCELLQYDFIFCHLIF
jgi:exportin-7